MRSKTYLIKLTFLFITILLFNISNLNSLENKIILKIDNEIITTLDIENEIKYLKALSPNIKNLEKKKLFQFGKNSLIREKVKKNEILKFIEIIKLEEAYLEKLIQDRYSKLNFKNKKEFLEYLKLNDVNIEQIEQKFSIEALWNELIYQKYISNIKIDEKELEIEIEKIYQKGSKSYLLSEIVFKIDNKNNLKKKYKEIKDSILSNGFENSVPIYSVSGTSDIGGKLGWIKENSLNKKILENLIKLNKNDITEPIFTPNGYLVLKIEDIRYEKIKFDKKKELDKLIKVKTNQQLNQYSNIYFNRVKKNLNINEL